MVLLLNIDEKTVKLFLNQNKSKIETKSFSGIGEIVSGISLGVTLLCSDTKKLPYISPLYFEIIIWIITISIFFAGIIQLVHSLLSHYTVDDLYNELVELDNSREHVFNIILLKNNTYEGKYLLFNSKRWKCKLFPNYHALSGQYNVENESLRIKEAFAADVGVSKERIETTYLGKINSRKYSYGDKVNKQYVFHFFSIGITTLIYEKNIKQKGSFRHNGKKFYWMTLDQMFANKNMMKKNGDVLNYVRNSVNIA